MIYAESLRIAVRPRQPSPDWLHAADPTSRDIVLPEVVADPTIHLIPQCDSEEDVYEFLLDLCEEIFVEQLASWLTDEESWFQDLSLDAFCRWFDWQHNSMLVDLRDEPSATNWTDFAACAMRPCEQRDQNRNQRPKNQPFAALSAIGVA